MAYQKILWKDSPSTDTPITATNLNKMDNAIFTNDANITTVTNNLNTTNTKLGNVASLNTTNKTSAVLAINEVNTKAINTNAVIGNKAELRTDNKTNIVSAINELNSKVIKDKRTFIPTLRGGKNPGSFIYGTNSAERYGTYYMIGPILFFKISMKITYCNIVPTGAVQISGLPYVSDGIGMCQSSYVSSPGTEQIRKINQWRLDGENTVTIGGKTSQVLVAQSFIPSIPASGRYSGMLWGLNFGDRDDDVKIEGTGAKDFTIKLSGMYIPKI